MVGDPFLISETSPSFWHLAQRCLSVHLAGTTVQGLPGCDKASSSMYLWEVSSNELTHLDEEVVYISYMNWRCSPCFAQRCYGSKGGGNADVVMAWRSAWLEAKVEARAGVHMRHLCCWLVVTPLSRQPESSTVHAIGVCHFLIKVCQFITMLLLNAWMILHHHSQNPCTVVAARDTLEHLELSAGRMEMSPSWRKDHPLSLNCHLTYCHYGVERVTFLRSMECIIPQFSTKYQKPSFIPIRCVVYTSRGITSVTRAAHLFSTILFQRSGS